jgi:hypothetical protein
VGSPTPTTWPPSSTTWPPSSNDVVAEVRRRPDVTPDELDLIDLPEDAGRTVDDLRRGRREITGCKPPSAR